MHNRTQKKSINTSYTSLLIHLFGNQKRVKLLENQLFWVHILKPTFKTILRKCIGFDDGTFQSDKKAPDIRQENLPKTENKLKQLLSQATLAPILLK